MGRAALANIKGKELTELVKETKPKTEDIDKVSETNKNRNTTNSDSREKKGRRRHKKKMMPAAVMVSPVQMLFNTCKDVFGLCEPGFIPAPDKIEKLRAVLDEIKPADVGLTPEMPFFSPPVTSPAPPITYLHLYECDKFSIGIFCLPPSGVIPLHNHPEMTVFSKLLFGTIHIKSYDWVVDAPSISTPVVDPSQIQQPEVRLAKVKVDSDFTAPCNASILYPADGGNMHCFTAVTACAVLDVLGPPYCDNQGRYCAYYHEYPFTNFLVDGVAVAEENEMHAWLQEREKPKDLAVVGALYTGPEIVEI